jgi:hypothetical protein
MKIIPRVTRLQCLNPNCRHVWIARSKHPPFCPRCTVRGKEYRVVDDFALLRERLLVQV